MNNVAGRIAAIALVLAAGCTTVSHPPRDLDWRAADIWIDPAPPKLVVEGYSSKVTAAAAGAAKGGGTGVAVATLSCMGVTGPLAPLCLVTVLPISAGIGAVGWATASAATSEGEEAVAAKRALLDTAAADERYASALAQHMRSAAQQRLAIDLATRELPAADARAQWHLEVAVTDIACEDAKPGQAHVFRVAARLRVRREGQAQPVYEGQLLGRSDALLTTDTWRSEGAIAARPSIDQALQRLASTMVGQLQGGAR